MTVSLYPNFQILICDDDTTFLRSISFAIERYCGINNTVQCSDSRKVLEHLAEGNIRVVLLDLNMPHISGEELLPQIIELYPHISVIIISGLNQVTTAVQCIKLGAYDYHVKTEEPERLASGIFRVVQFQELGIENEAMRQQLLNNKTTLDPAFSKIISADSQMHSIFRYIESISKSKQPILVTGESGVGKELIARAIHETSQCAGELVCINVAGLDDNMFSDTLFGHRRGAFTGANQSRQGMIERASGGTLFLDEIGDLSLASQVKLLRLLQEGEYYPIGSDTPKKINSRVIAATHQDLEKKKEEHNFRNDLYYRLKIHHIEVPALRDRKSDISLLLEHFLTLAAEEFSKSCPTVSSELHFLLSNYDFPGNVRELRSMVYDAMSTCEVDSLPLNAFEKIIGGAKQSSLPRTFTAPLFQNLTTLPTLKQANNLLIEEALLRAEGKQSLAARILGISQPALSKRLKKREDE
ncbi:sigma-54 dependent transcriptional regulator [Psychromonas arctica]|uniref:sigma-54-dependent transcriptional regulator n=1 Tax=Psychromonas arctica TaxID=168275 RepID=UPI002FCFF150